MNFLLGFLGGMSVSNTTPLVLKSRFSMINLKCNNKHCVQIRNVDRGFLKSLKCTFSTYSKGQLFVSQHLVRTWLFVVTSLLRMGVKASHWKGISQFSQHMSPVNASHCLHLFFRLVVAKIWSSSFQWCLFFSVVLCKTSCFYMSCF